MIGIRRKGCVVKGKDLKSLIHRPKGVLVVKDKNMYFVGEDDKTVTVLIEVCDKEKNLVFISEEFDKLNALIDDEEYNLDFKNGALEVWEKNHKIVILALMGILL